MTNQALQSLNGEVYDFWNAWLKSTQTQLVVNIAYPSVSGWDSECQASEEQICYQLNDFSVPAAEIKGLDVGFVEQASAYQAIFSAVTRQNWIDGIISRGYFSPAILHDKSISIHGKPAEELLWRWFEALR